MAGEAEVAVVRADWGAPGGSRSRFHHYVLLPALASFACYASYQNLAEGGGGPADDAAAPEDAWRDDAGGPDAEARDDIVDDAHDSVVDGGDAAVELCPATLSTPGAVSLRVAWRRNVSSDWTEPGSAALAIVDNVVLVIVPQPDGLSPMVLRLAADSGAVLDDAPPRLDATFDSVTALAATTTSGGTHALVAARGTAADGTADLVAGTPTAGGAVRDVFVRPVVLDGVTVRDLQLAVGPRTYAATGGYAAPSGWMLHAVTLDASDEPGEPTIVRVFRPASPAPAAGFVAWGAGGPAGDGAVLWSQPDALELREVDDSPRAAVPLDPSEPFAPIAAEPSDLVFEPDFLRAGSDSADGATLWVEHRAGTDLGCAASSTLADWVAALDRPEPRALERTGDREYVLAWVARRSLGDGGPVPSCLYITPFEAASAPGGRTVRVDPGVAESHLPGIEQVRIATGAGAVYVLWRQPPEVWVVRLDRDP
ncbi:MAG: hypothetical protein HY905_13980 [Deltaproteobacteria bacterium]|nr:hypothetical protein [Deltaproteobacteria bacterium]